MAARPPAEVLEELLVSAGIAAADVPPTAERRSALWRSHLSARRVLLVLDNARDAEQVRPILPGSGPGRCLVLVTSRRRLAELEATAIVEVKVLDPADAVDLLIQASRQDPDRFAGARAELATVAALCGFLPLALRAVAGLLAHMTPGELAEVMRSARYPLQHLAQADRAAAAAYRVSSDALDDSLRDLLRACASHPGPDFDADSVAALTGRPRPLVAVQLAELADSNMLLGLPLGRYGFHSLFLGYARRDATDHQDADLLRAGLDRLCTGLLNRMDVAAGLIYTDSQYLRRSSTAEYGFTDREQAQTWMGAAADELVTTAQAALAAELPQAPGFALRLGYWLHAAGKSDQPIALYEAVRAAAHAAGDHTGEADALSGLGLVTYAHGEFGRAAEAYQAARALYEQVGNHRAQAETVRGLADVGRVLGSYRDAQDNYQRALDLYETAEDARGQADSLKGLGDVAFARGDGPRARAAYQRAADLCARIGYRNGQADALTGLGDSAMLDGDPATAESAFRQSHDIYLATGNVHGLAYAYKGLGDATRTLGDLANALAWYRQADELYQRIGFPATHADVLRGTGDAARAQGDTDRAAALYQRAYDLSAGVRYLGGQADALKALGDLAREASDTPRARACYRQAAELYDRTGNAAGQEATRRLLNDL
ncbi:tetratricopeptide repeat protein [Nocardia sp. NPDC050435]|uniref:tetratricopeptide repeat protein n=1 Tax=Nocardia sp. NPDC050435 TaxID=3155040 RepID=UPI0033F8B49C